MMRDAATAAGEEQRPGCAGCFRSAGGDPEDHACNVMISGVRICILFAPLVPSSSLANQKGLHDDEASFWKKRLPSPRGRKVTHRAMAQGTQEEEEEESYLVNLKR